MNISEIFGPVFLLLKTPPLVQI